MESAICLARTLRILEVKSNALGWTAARRIKYMAKSMEIFTKKSSYKLMAILGTHLSFRLLRCNQKYRTSWNKCKLLISFLCSFLLINVKVNAAMWLVDYSCQDAFRTLSNLLCTFRGRQQNISNSFTLFTPPLTVKCYVSMCAFHWMAIYFFSGK